MKTKSAVILVWMVACGTSKDAGTSPASVEGAVGGSPFVAKDAIFVRARPSGLAVSPSTVVLVSDFPDACQKQARDAGVANGRLLIFGLAVTDSDFRSTPATSSGDYDIISASSPPPPPPNSRLADVFYERDGADCLREENIEATSGKVTMTTPDLSGMDRIEATFDLTFGATGGHITGRFSALPCTSFNPNRTPLATCQ